MPGNEQKPEGAIGLYDAVKGTSTKNLRNSVESVDALTPEEEADLERGGAYALRGTKRKIARKAWWAAFIFASVLVTGLCVALLTILGFFVYNVVQTGTMQEILSAVLDFVFGVVFTLAVEFFWWRGTRPKE